MRITKVSLPVRSTAEWVTFCVDLLGLPANPSRAAVQIGTTTIEFRQDPQPMGDHHLAFLIPEAKFDAARRWVGERAEILRLDGVDEFECSPAWNAHSVYFDGPEGSVLELIARRDLPHGSLGPFGPSDLLAVSEVGVTVDSVGTTADRLAARAAIEPYAGEPGDDFGPVGTTEGLLILVTEGRTWFPTADRTAGISSIDVEVTGATGGTGGLEGRLPLGDGTLDVRDPPTELR